LTISWNSSGRLYNLANIALSVLSTRAVIKKTIGLTLGRAHHNPGLIMLMKKRMMLLLSRQSLANATENLLLLSSLPLKKRRALVLVL
jgi:hypothetical protein